MNETETMFFAASVALDSLYDAVHALEIKAGPAFLDSIDPLRQVSQDEQRYADACAKIMQAKRLVNDACELTR